MEKGRKKKKEREIGERNKTVSMCYADVCLLKPYRKKGKGRKGESKKKGNISSKREGNNKRTNKQVERRQPMKKRE